jgi:membrane fusion protein (multidrug efflux system)
MAITFSRSMRSLRADSQRPSLVTMAVVLVLLVGWGIWFLLARVDVHEVTAEARVEVDTSAHVVGAPVSGRVVAVDMEVGQPVEAGHPLLLLRAEQESSRVQEQGARLDSLRQRRITLEEARLAERKAVGQARLADTQALDRARAQHRETLAAHRFAIAELGRIRELHGKGLASQADLERAEAEAEQRQAEIEAAEREVRRLEFHHRERERERETRLLTTDRQIAALNGELEMAEAELRLAADQLQERVIKAPVAGRLGDVVPLRPGAVVEAGDRIAVVIPPGELKMVALFPVAAALGRVQPGQPARVRLDSFPWIRWGQVGAQVTRVGSEPVGGRIRVELSLDASSSDIPLQHGLSGTVAVTVDRVSPAGLLLDVLGKRLDGSPARTARDR